jgi:hypothetical protein
MRNFLDGVPADAFDPENDDTIEMVLSESAMQMLSQAAAPTEQPRPNPALKAPELLTIPEVRVIPKVGANPEAAAIPEVAAHPEMPVIPEARPIPAGASVPEVRSIPDVRAIAGEPAPRAPRPAMSTPRLALLLSSVAVASALVTAVTYFAMTRPGRPGPVATSVVSIPPAPVTVAPPPPPAPLPAPELSTPPEPVQFVNPFDRKEVFEFPAGTSKAEARDAVAELLYERAQERQLSVRGLVSGMSVRHTTNATAAAAPAARKAAP